MMLRDNLKKKLIILLGSFILIYAVSAVGIPNSKRATKAISNHTPLLKKQLQAMNLKLGSPVFIRIFKQTNELEVFVQDALSKKFKLFKTYPICNYSGSLGPKLKQGDHQSPEGFYFVKQGQLNPQSSFHLSFNLGYPNKYDRYHGRTGDFLMVHGNCVSVGCYAMTDEKIEEIYTLVYAALNNGQGFFRVHAFPFKMNALNMQKNQSHPWYGFWENLKQGYDYFELNGMPPNVEVVAGKYVFN